MTWTFLKPPPEKVPLFLAYVVTAALPIVRYPDDTVLFGDRIVYEFSFESVFVSENMGKSRFNMALDIVDDCRVDRTFGFLFCLPTNVRALLLCLAAKFF